MTIQYLRLKFNQPVLIVEQNYIFSLNFYGFNFLAYYGMARWNSNFIVKRNKNNMYDINNQ